jgi:hypothetical protein
MLWCGFLIMEKQYVAEVIAEGNNIAVDPKFVG